jgi:putative transposase
VSKAVELFEGARVMMSHGPAVIVHLDRYGVTAKDAIGENHFVRADQLAVAGLGEGGLQAVHRSIQPWWSSLTPTIRSEVLLKLEVVLEILTGYRDGHP